MSVPQRRPEDLPANLKSERSIHMLHRIAIKGADGSSSLYEREIEGNFQSVTQGSSHFVSPNGRPDDDHDHLRINQSNVKMRELFQVKDAAGNLFIDEKQVGIKDGTESHGRKLISSNPERGDQRQDLISGFNKGSLFGGKGFGMRLLSDGKEDE